MSWRLLAVAALVSSGLAGCIAQSPGSTNTDSALGADSILGKLGIDHLLKAGPALWNDPQNTPHPKWGWATLSNPPAGKLPAAWMPIKGVDLPAHIAGIKQL